MKRFIVLGLVLALLSGCATINVMGKPPESVTVEDKTDMLWEWVDWVNFVLGFCW